MTVDAVPPRTRGRRRREMPRSRDAVAGAVRDLLRVRRLDDLTVNEIVERAGISRPTFYANFETKYSVVAALIENVGDGILEVWAPLFDGDGPIEEEQLREVGIATIRHWRGQGSLFTATVEGWHTDGEIHDAWSHILDQFTARLIPRIRRAGVAENEIELLAGILVTGFERALYMAVSTPDSVFARGDDELAAGLAKVWSRTLAT